MVFRGRRTLKTLRDFIVLMSRPLLFLLTLKHSIQERSCTHKPRHKDMWHRHIYNSVKEKTVEAKCKQVQIKKHNKLHLECVCMEPGRCHR